ncbi:hypothetical protein BX616_003113 [Lobosporangium transversale]|uniref:Dolichyl-diphosphooligosaccharide-protein glycosyltransferase subunit OST5 n=1 Tax=Lobosporangium transversale TaxID=64571 RepID=A0A1Y2G971_9FUNG|nr:hypothetical protein BCR41DRAFT_362410 [Lobosporangium transversale]KAF9916689.1 hypothetical protein BX616_003113 [Lobosporangium transversale]ORZ04674.1 hypothetical protein BCR41DRAFT_362410 [Lobosporangium transversale]|eukprot:XP_021876671.1 hypothetical protein BCR41DRAFT_362410 [Lobosporangium transversale]
MSATFSELNEAWSAGTPFAPPLPVSVHPPLAMLTLSVGLLFAAKFGVAQKPSLVHDLATTIPSALLLGFGTVFLFLAVGLYV